MHQQQRHHGCIRTTQLQCTTRRPMLLNMADFPGGYSLAGERAVFMVCSTHVSIEHVPHGMSCPVRTPHGGFPRLSCRASLCYASRAIRLLHALYSAYLKHTNH
jgi:hypothetical protein